MGNNDLKLYLILRPVVQKMLFKDFSIIQAGGHFVQLC